MCPMLVVAIMFNRWVVLVFSVLLPAVVAAKVGSTSTHNDPELGVRNPSQAIFLRSQDYNNLTNILLTAAIPAYIHFTHLSIFGIFSCLKESNVQLRYIRLLWGLF